MLTKVLAHKEQPDEKVLLKQMALGNYSAFTLLYKKYVKQLMHYGLKFTTDIQLIEDAIHDLFVWLWNNRSQFLIQASLKSYLLKSIRTSLLQKISKGQKLELLENEENAYPFQLFISTEDQYISSEDAGILKERVAHLLSLLTPKQKEVIYLRFYQGLSFDEIAQNMELSVKACYKLMGRAISELRKTSLQTVLVLILLVLLNFSNFF
jgi:RNA polymerase sigma factor (sigma-70 family)